MAGLLNQVTLEMILKATDEASAPLKDLIETVDLFKESLLSLADANPLADLQDSIAGLMDDVSALRDEFSNLKDAMDTAGSSEGLSAMTATIGELATKVEDLSQQFRSLGAETVQGAVDSVTSLGEELTTTLEDAVNLRDELGSVGQESMSPVREATSSLTDGLNSAREAATTLNSELREASNQPMAPLTDALSNVRDSVSGAVDKVSALVQQFKDAGMTADDVKAAIESLGTTVESAMSSGATVVHDMAMAYQQLTQDADQAAAAVARVGEAASGGGAAGRVTFGSTLGAIGEAAASAGKAASEFANGLMMTAMNGFMALWGAQSVVGAANQFGTIQAMMQANPGMTVNEAAQALAMLGTQGVSGLSAVSTLTGIKGSLASQFTSLNGVLPKSAIQLESLGLGPGVMTGSPWQVLQAIGRLYRQYTASGNSEAASKLLSLTGTGNFQELFNQWNVLQSQAQKQINLNMTPGQVNQAAQQGQSLAMSLQAVSLAFAQLALKLTPLVKQILDGLRGFMHIFSGKGNIVHRIVSAFDGLHGAVAKATAALIAMGAVAEGAKAAKTGWNVFQAIWGAGAAAGGYLFGKGGKSGVLSPVVDFLANLGKGAKGSLASKLPDIGDLLGKVADILNPEMWALAFTPNPLAKTPSPPLFGKGSAWGKLIATLSAQFHSTVQQITQHFSDAIKTIKVGPTIRSVINDIRNTFETDIKGIQLGPTIRSVISAIHNAFETAIKGINVVDAITSKIHSIAGDFRSSIKGINVVSAITKFVNGIATTFESQFSNAMSAVQTFIGGIIGGLQSMIAGMISGVESFMAGAAHAAASVKIPGTGIHPLNAGNIMGGAATVLGQAATNTSLAALPGALSAGMIDAFGASVASHISETIRRSGNTVNITVNVPPSLANDRARARQIAQMVASETVRGLQIKVQTDSSFGS
ncbi:MAG: hypothetical protein K6V73_10905 [Firmicutes bacterium]|nr:hypothetical protein [Bacillota bacterium]